MKKLEDTLVTGFLELNYFLLFNKIKYCLIGAMAANFWGSPRETNNIDFIIALPPDGFDWFIELLNSNAFETVKVDPHQIQVTHKAGVEFEADLFLTATEFQEWVVRRAIPIELFEAEVPMCTPEDLILMKTSSGLEKDWQDIEKVLKIRAQEIDQEYVNKWLRFWNLEKVFQKKIGDSW